MARPKGYRKSPIDYKRQYKDVISALKQGLSLRQTAKLTGRSINTIRKIKAM